MAWQTADGQMVWVLDLDGVVWLAGHPIPGSAEAIGRLRRAGERPVFVTNNSGPTVADYIRMLGDAGVEVTADDLVSSAQAAASLVAPGTRAAVHRRSRRGRGPGGRGASRSWRPTPGPMPSSWVAPPSSTTTAGRGGHRHPQRRPLRGHQHRRHLSDTRRARSPGRGRIVAFLQVASGVAPEVAGKPHQPVADLILDRFGPVSVAVGDRLDTDGALATALGAPFALVLTGVTKPSDLPAEPAPDVVADDLAGRL